MRAMVDVPLVADIHFVQAAVDADGSHSHTRRHLHDREQRVG